METRLKMSKAITKLVARSMGAPEQLIAPSTQTGVGGNAKFGRPLVLQQLLSVTEKRKSYARDSCTASESSKKLLIRKFGSSNNYVSLPIHVFRPHALPPRRCFSTLNVQTNCDKDYLDIKDPGLCDILPNNMIVKREFLSEEEEKSLLNEVDKYMRRLRYEFDHWDNAIHGYRETEKKQWNENNSGVLQRVKDLAFTSDITPLAYVHVLDIAKDGYIKPHVDAVRFCGDTITGMCLLSSCVMRLALEKDSTKYADVYLPRRCLYIMRGPARYEFTHEVLKDEQSYFKGQHVPRDRRISIICRNEPAVMNEH